MWGCCHAFSAITDCPSSEPKPEETLLPLSCFLSDIITAWEKCDKTHTVSTLFFETKPLSKHGAYLIRRYHGSVISFFPGLELHPCMRPSHGDLNSGPHLAQQALYQRSRLPVPLLRWALLRHLLQLSEAVWHRRRISAWERDVGFDNWILFPSRFIFLASWHESQWLPSLFLRSLLFLHSLTSSELKTSFFISHSRGETRSNSWEVSLTGSKVTPGKPTQIKMWLINWALSGDAVALKGRVHPHRAPLWASLPIFQIYFHQVTKSWAPPQ